MERDASGLASRSLSTEHSLHSKWGGKGKKPTAESQTEVHPEDAAKAWKSSEMCSQDTRFEIVWLDFQVEELQKARAVVNPASQPPMTVVQGFRGTPQSAV